MKTTSIITLAGLFVMASSNASAYTSWGIQDAWQLDTTGGGINSVTTNIGHLNLSGGIGYINQSFGGNGVLDAGDPFTEYGAIFSISVTPENCFRGCDSGFPASFTSPLAGLRLVYTGLAGILTSVDGITGAVTYAFNPGVGNIAIEGSTDGISFTTLANLYSISPSGGSLGNFLGGILPNGTTDILTRISLNGYTSNLFRDSTGAALDGLIYVGKKNFNVGIHTQNTLGQAASCTTDGLGNVLGCDLVVNSDGSLNLFIPEPGTVALIGLGLMALVGFRRYHFLRSGYSGATNTWAAICRHTPYSAS